MPQYLSKTSYTMVCILYMIAYFNQINVNVTCFLFNCTVPGSNIHIRLTWLKSKELRFIILNSYKRPLIKQVLSLWIFFFYDLCSLALWRVPANQHTLSQWVNNPEIQSEANNPKIPTRKKYNRIESSKNYFSQNHLKISFQILKCVTSSKRKGSGHSYLISTLVTNCVGLK